MRARRTPVLVDVVVALALSILSVVTLAEAPGPSVGVLGGALAVLAVAPVALRQLAPALTLLVIASALVAWVLLDHGGWPSGGLGLIFAMFTVATLRPARVAAAVFPVTVLVLVVESRSVADPSWTAVAHGSLVFVCAWALGHATRRWVNEAGDAAARAERAVAAERTRVARELHDVVAHHMSVVALQAGLASYVLRTDPHAAQRAITHAQDAGQEALRDMRRMLDALRPDDDPAPNDPQPGLSELDALVDRVRATGLAVAVSWSGTTDGVGAGAQLCAYRVVQESLTNVLKHAGPGAVAHVAVLREDAVLRVDVTDDGPTSTVGDIEEPGRGIRGMRERAALYGGTLEAGPGPGGGFSVRLRLPVGALTPQATTLASAAR
jgi:signal transduction histidine kinase